MKVKVLLVALGCAMVATGAYAQKGVDNGTRFGSGEDSIRCITNISLFTPYAKTGNYKDALQFWQIAYNECPAATKDIYLYGVRIVNWQISNETDPAKKASLINDLMGVYDKRVKYFGDDQKYSKDWIVAHKVQDYMSLMGDKTDYNKTYDWTKAVIDQFGDKCDALAVSQFAFSSLQKMKADPNFKQTYIQDYLKSIATLEAELKATTDEKEQTNINAYKSSIDQAFAVSGAADCKTIQNMYASKIEQNKDNLEFLKSTLSLFRGLGCQEIDAYLTASAYVYAKEPTAEAALGLGKQAFKDKDFNAAIKYFDEAANLDKDNKSKSDDYYMIAAIYSDRNSYSTARSYCQKAIDANPSNGKAYILIGSMYASTAPSIYPGDAVLAKAVYYAAIDKFERAKSVDPSCASEANRMIATCRVHLPSTEDIFMHPELEKGKSFHVGGWIGENTVVR